MTVLNEGLDVKSASNAPAWDAAARECSVALTHSVTCRQGNAHMDGYTCEECSKLNPPLRTNTTTLSFARHTRAVLSTYLPTYLHVAAPSRISTNGNGHFLLQKQMRGSSGSNTLPNDAVPWVVSAASFGPVGWASGNKRRWSSSSHRLSMRCRWARAPVPSGDQVKHRQLQRSSDCALQTSNDGDYYCVGWPLGWSMRLQSLPLFNDLWSTNIDATARSRLVNLV